MLVTLPSDGEAGSRDWIGYFQAGAPASSGDVCHEALALSAGAALPGAKHYFIVGQSAKFRAFRAPLDAVLGVLGVPGRCQACVRLGSTTGVRRAAGELCAHKRYIFMGGIFLMANVTLRLRASIK